MMISSRLKYHRLCTALHCTVIPLYYTMIHCITLKYSVSYCNTLQYTVKCSALRWNALYILALHSDTIDVSVLHGTTLQRSHCTKFSSVWCSAAQRFGEISESIGSTHHCSPPYASLSFMQNSARKRDSIKATFVGTRLIVQTNVAQVLLQQKDMHALLSLICLSAYYGAWPAETCMWHVQRHLVQTFWQWCGEALGARRNTVKSTVGKETDTLNGTIQRL